MFRYQPREVYIPILRFAFWLANVAHKFSFVSEKLTLHR